jgi:hypothetical protein
MSSLGVAPSIQPEWCPAIRLLYLYSYLQFAESRCNLLGEGIEHQANFQ